MWKDLQFSLRTLRRSALFTTIAVLSLALGIGANTAIFSLLDQVTLRSLPVQDPGRLVVLHIDRYQAPGSATSDNMETVFSYPMYRDLRDRDPALVYTEVPYEKGRLFLTYLDAKFGRERFDAFLRGYFDHFEFQGISTEDFERYLEENLLDRFPGIVTRAEVAAWISGPGIPPDAVLPTTDAFTAVDEARDAWYSRKVAAKKLDVRDWSAQQWKYFLDGMPQPLGAAQMAELDQAFTLTGGANAEIGRSWYMLVIRNQYQPSYARLEEYLQTIGRRKLIAPLYEELMKTPAGAVQAKRVYKLARPGYHPQAAAAIDAIVISPSDGVEESDE